MYSFGRWHLLVQRAAILGEVPLTLARWLRVTSGLLGRLEAASDIGKMAAGDQWVTRRLEAASDISKMAAGDQWVTWKLEA